jgi:hypothetical protein
MPIEPNESEQSKPGYVGIPPSELESLGLENYKQEVEPELYDEETVVEPLVDRDEMGFEPGTDQRGEERARIIEDGYIPDNDGVNPALDDEGDGQAEPEEK